MFPPFAVCPANWPDTNDVPNGCSKPLHLRGLVALYLIPERSLDAT